MPNILDIRRRIRSVKSTQQITRAMKMVAAARLRRAQEQVVSARPYANHMRAVLQSLMSRTTQREHPLLAVRPVKRVLLVLVTSDRGLCGAFNANLIRNASAYYEQNPNLEILLMPCGRKGRDFFRRRNVRMAAEYPNLFGKRLDFSQARAIAEEVIDIYQEERVDAVDVMYNEFKSVITQRMVVERFLPIYVQIEIFRALLETQAAELAARMTAMDTATKNAGELIDSLTLNMNRVRQAGITREIIEIVGGAAAL
jgi:F-type H+-transporting ATPase subunit gamma